MVMNFALGVEMILLNISLMVRRSAVGVPQSPGWLIRSPPIVIWLRYGSFFSERYAHTMRPYVMSLRRSCGICCFVTNAIVSVIVASRRISYLNDWPHTSLYFGCLSKCRYSRRSPVSSSRIEYAKSHKNCSGYFRELACLAVNNWFGRYGVSIR